MQGGYFVAKPGIGRVDVGHRLQEREAGNRILGHGGVKLVSKVRLKGPSKLRCAGCGSEITLEFSQPHPDFPGLLHGNG